MKQTFIILAAATLVLASCRKQTFDERVQAEVEFFNVKEAPKRLDTATTFDSMQYNVQQKTISYFYTVQTDIPIDQFPREDMKQELLHNLRHSIQLKAHKDHGLLFHYHYILQPSGDTLIDCTFTPEEYK